MPFCSVQITEWKINDNLLVQCHSNFNFFIQSGCGKQEIIVEFCSSKEIFIQTNFLPWDGLSLCGKGDANVMIMIVILWWLESLTQDDTKDLVFVISYSSVCSFVMCFIFIFWICFCYAYSFPVWMLGLRSWLTKSQWCISILCKQDFYISKVYNKLVTCNTVVNHYNFLSRYFLCSFTKRTQTCCFANQCILLQDAMVLVIINTHFLF